MIKRQKFLASTITLALATAAPINLYGGVHAQASVTPSVEVAPSYTIENLKDTAEEQSFTMIMNDNTEVDFQMETEDNIITLRTTTNGVEEHTFEYEQGESFAIFDGERISVEKETFIEPELQTTETITPLLRATSPSSPVYLSSGKIKIGKAVKTTGAIVTLIGGGIAAAALSGVAIASSTIASTVANWASVVGLGTLAAGWYFDGNITFKQYRTYGKIATGYGNNKQTGFRFQDIRAVGTVKGKKMDKQLRATGSWFFSSKPF
ncbi:hypothetical protein [Listeria booriae]|uniref:hypothetical protein n=1 Tax=Listeria booriae TaxID=1552123 RepID=UPI00162AB481|nr:hypothetical protein [Listeria booriae]MBC2304001.1 hypothetical protein [Listeria booriae]